MELSKDYHGYGIPNIDPDYKAQISDSTSSFQTYQQGFSSGLQMAVVHDVNKERRIASVTIGNMNYDEAIIMSPYFNPFTGAEIGAAWEKGAMCLGCVINGQPFILPAFYGPSSPIPEDAYGFNSIGTSPLIEPGSVYMNSSRSSGFFSTLIMSKLGHLKMLAGRTVRFMLNPLNGLVTLLCQSFIFGTTNMNLSIVDDDDIQNIHIDFKPDFEGEETTEQSIQATLDVGTYGDYIMFRLGSESSEKNEPLTESVKIHISRKGDITIYTKGDIEEEVEGDYTKTIHGNYTQNIDGVSTINYNGKADISFKDSVDTVVTGSSKEVVSEQKTVEANIFTTKSDIPAPPILGNDPVSP